VEERITASLAKYGDIDAKVISVSEVGPSWGEKVSTQALLALGLFFVAIALYLSVRFEMKMAAAAIAAVVHDILITVGVYAVTGIEVTPATVIAFLTILGFSLYDTVVVFDKIKENTPQLTTVRGLTYTAMANRSLNQVLMRSLNTSFVALLPVTSLLVVGVGLEGALALREFGLALFIGLIVGAYSSIFVATPLLVWWKEREPRYRTLAERSSVRAEREAAAAMSTTFGEDQDEAAEVAAAGAGAAPAAKQGKTTPAAKPSPGAMPGTTSGPVIQPRPRQQRSRKRK
jgi:preprotein translocase subunit SecF